MSWTLILVACLLSSVIGGWIGWQARTLKYDIDRKSSVEQNWDRRQAALRTMRTVSERTRHDPPDWDAELQRQRGN